MLMDILVLNHPFLHELLHNRDYVMSFLKLNVELG